MHVDNIQLKVPNHMHVVIQLGNNMEILVFMWDTIFYS